MQNEKNASLERLEEISPDAPVRIKFASYYNAGIIAQREGDYEKAIECFKMALLVSPEDVNAKVNLELSQTQETQKAKEGQQEMMPASDNSDTESEIEKILLLSVPFWLGNSYDPFIKNCNHFTKYLSENLFFNHFNIIFDNYIYHLEK